MDKIKTGEALLDERSQAIGIKKFAPSAHSAGASGDANSTACLLRVGRILAIEDALHLLEVREGHVPVGLPAARGLLRERMRHDVELLARRIGKHQRLAGFL